MARRRTKWQVLSVAAGLTIILVLASNRISPRVPTREPSLALYRLGTPNIGSALVDAADKAVDEDRDAEAEVLARQALAIQEKDPDAAVAVMLEQTGLRDRAGEQLGRLSGGNRQRVNIAIGLLAEPAVALLDEPSASLDPRQRERLWQFISARAQAGTSIVFTTHDIGEAERYAGRVLVLADGELLFSGSPADLRRHGSGDMESAFVTFLRERGH